MEIKDFKNKRITIMGLGLHGGGIGAAKFFAKAGAKVLVTDLKNKKELAPSIKQLKKFENIKYILGKHRKEDFTNADLVIQGAGVPFNSSYLKIAEKREIPIDTDVGIFFQLTRINANDNTGKRGNKIEIIGVTGTKGKSTTSTLIYEFLKTKYKNVFLAGNIRTSVFDIYPKLNKNSIVVLELSSWQLEGLKRHKKSPHIAVITNILPDHLNRYEGMSNYAEAKKNIFKYQKLNDYLILNPQDEYSRKFVKEAKSRVIFSRINTNLTQISRIIVPTNISLAAEVAKLYKISQKSIKKSLKNFKGLEGRLEFVKSINGVKYYNDTTATIPDAAIFALDALKSKTKKIILIAGGVDKIKIKSPYKRLAKIIKKTIKCVIILPGSASDILIKELSGLKYKNIHKTNTMAEAMKKSISLAQEGDIVLLSPAAASFNLFRHEFDRGNEFKKTVRNLSRFLKIT